MYQPPRYCVTNEDGSINEYWMKQQIEEDMRYVRDVEIRCAIIFFGLIIFLLSMIILLIYYLYNYAS